MTKKQPRTIEMTVFVKAAKAAVASSMNAGTIGKALRSRYANRLPAGVVGKGEPVIKPTKLASTAITWQVQTRKSRTHQWKNRGRAFEVRSSARLRAKGLRYSQQDILTRVVRVEVQE